MCRYQLLDLIHGEHVRERSPSLRELQLCARIDRRIPLAHQVTVVRSHRRYLASDTGGGQAQILQFINEFTQQLCRYFLRSVDVFGNGKLGKSTDVARVVRNRVFAVADLETEIILKSLEPERMRDFNIWLVHHLLLTFCAADAAMRTPPLRPKPLHSRRRPR